MTNEVAQSYWCPPQIYRWQLRFFLKSINIIYFLFFPSHKRTTFPNTKPRKWETRTIWNSHLKNIWRSDDKKKKSNLEKHKREKFTFVSDKSNCIDLISISFSATNRFASSSFSCISFTWFLSIDFKTSSFSDSFVCNSLTCSLSLVSSSFS